MIEATAHLTGTRTSSSPFHVLFFDATSSASSKVKRSLLSKSKARSLPFNGYRCKVSPPSALFAVYQGAVFNYISLVPDAKHKNNAWGKALQV